MGRGYWLPPRKEHLTAYDGFYLDSNTVYGNDISAGWDKLLHSLSIKLMYKEKSFIQYCNWKSCGLGQSYFILLYNKHIEIIVEDVDEYIAVYAIIPEDCPTPGFAKRSFPKYITLLKDALTNLYPGAVSKRINSQRIRKVG